MTIRIISNELLMAFSVGYQIILNTMPVILLKEVPKGVALGLVVSIQAPPLR